MTTFAPVSTLPITSTFVATLQTSVVVPSSTIPLPSSASPFPTPTTAIYAVPVPPNYVPSPVASYVPASVQSPPVASYVPASVSVAPVATNLYSGTGRVTMVIGMTVFGALFAF
ncbi:hypothetical protein BC830DRAFT_1170808 [Chytriomyces sp. MP71]|nr:hypothetical protein BC830DRAFT_1170808 [Chytriomyces sp. MP71]